MIAICSDKYPDLSGELVGWMCHVLSKKFLQDILNIWLVAVLLWLNIVQCFMSCREIETRIQLRSSQSWSWKCSLEWGIRAYICIEYTCTIYDWLVVWNIWIIFPYIGNVIVPTDELIFFRGVGSTTNQMIYGYIKTISLRHSEWCIEGKGLSANSLISSSSVTIQPRYVYTDTIYIYIYTYTYIYIYIHTVYTSRIHVFLIHFYPARSSCKELSFYMYLLFS